MEIRNIELIQYVEELKKHKDKKYPQKIVFAIIKNLNTCELELKNYYECLTKIMNNYKDHFIKDEDGNIKCLPSGLPVVDESNNQTFIDEINQLLNETVDIQLYTIDMDYFDYDPKDIYDIMTPSDLFTLSKILCQ